MGFIMRRVSVLDSTNTRTAATITATSTGTSISPRKARSEWRDSDRRMMLPSSSFTAAYTVSVPSVSEKRMVAAWPFSPASRTSGRPAWFSMAAGSAALS